MLLILIFLLMNFLLQGKKKKKKMPEQILRNINCTWEHTSLQDHTYCLVLLDISYFLW